MLTNLLLWLGINVVFGLATQGRVGNVTGVVDIWGHFGGLLGGAIFAWFGGPKIGLREDEYPPTLRDTRTASDVLLAAILVLGLFGGAAIAAILFLPPPVS